MKFNKLFEITATLANFILNNVAMKHLDLADEDTDEGCSDSIDILIGTDYYWQVVP